MSTGTRRVFRTDPRTLDAQEEHHGARFSACHLPPATVLVTVEGEVDATNARSLAAYIEQQIAGSQRLVLDLTAVDFFGTAGFAALRNVHVICVEYGASWTLLAGRQVCRLLMICDADGSLPIQHQELVLATSDR